MKNKECPYLNGEINPWYNNGQHVVEKERNCNGYYFKNCRRAWN